MWPTLWEGAWVQNYGILLALGLLLANLLARRLGRDYGLSPKLIDDITFWCAVAGIIGARATHVMEYWSDYPDENIGKTLLNIINIRNGGLTYYGGFIGGVLAGWWVIARSGHPVFRVMDVCAPALALGHGIGRIGCFAAGCCYGKACPEGFPFGVIYPDNWWPGRFSLFSEEARAASRGEHMALHPTQLYETVGELLLCLILIVMLRRKLKTGRVISAYAAGYGLLRFGVEFLRADNLRYQNLTLSQWISIGVFTLGVCGFFLIRDQRGAVANS